MSYHTFTIYKIVTIVLVVYLTWYVTICFGEISTILDEFTLTSNSHCSGSPPGAQIRHGNVENSEQCALLCLEYEDCQHFQWDHAQSQRCSLKDVCDFAVHSTCNTYSTDKALARLEVPDISRMPGMITLIDRDSSGFDYGLMYNMDENVCAMHCLLIAHCVASLWLTELFSHPNPSISPKNCYLKNRAGGRFTTLSNLNSHMKAVVSGCVPGFSCYAILAHEDGQTRDQAVNHCASIGGHLAEFDSQEELDAVKDAGTFDAYSRPLWLGIKLQAGQWIGETSGSAAPVLPWAPGQPGSHTSVTIDPHSSWQLSTTSATDIAFPMCELESITTTNSGQAVPNVNDGNVATCFTLQTPFTGNLLTTRHLNPGSPQSILVKVHGDGIMCSSPKTMNIHVLQSVVFASGSLGSYTQSCPHTGGYIWQQKQLCLFQCTCQADTCDEVHLMLDTATSVSICEFQIL